MKISFVQEKNESLQAALLSRFAELGKNRVRALIKRREVKINGVRTGENVLLKKGDTVEGYVPDALFPKIDVRVIYSDDNLVVADKPSGVDSVGALPRILYSRFGTLYPVHRLDTNTTGVIMLARNEDILKDFIVAFKNKKIKKVYEAVVTGALPAKKGVISSRLVRDESGLVKTSVRGAIAETDYELVSTDGETSVVRLYPKTGRTHQLRVQLASIGCPIVGDGKYGSFEKNKACGCKKQLLRAVSLTIEADNGALARYKGMSFSI